MSYVVRAIFPEAQPKWLTIPKRDGCRTFGARDQAEAFETVEVADAAITAMLDSTPCGRINFSVEATQFASLMPLF